MRRSVKVYILSLGNYSWSHLVAQIRSLADQFGRPGIIGKRGQTNRRVRQQGYFRIVMPNKQMAIKYQNAVESFWGDLVETKRFRLG